jgi:hypothetical protein
MPAAGFEAPNPPLETPDWPGVADPALAEPPEETPPCPPTAEPPAAEPPEAEPPDAPNPEAPALLEPAPVPFEATEPFELAEVLDSAPLLEAPFEAGAPLEPAMHGAPHAASDSTTATATGAMPRIRRFLDVFIFLLPLRSLKVLWCGHAELRDVSGRK